MDTNKLTMEVIKPINLGLYATRFVEELSRLLVKLSVPLAFAYEATAKDVVLVFVETNMVPIKGINNNDSNSINN